MTLTPVPGDVWAVSTGTSLVATAIEAGELLAGLPALDNHVVGVHHQTTGGQWWGVEGRPGGVGWADLTRYLDEPTTVSNQDQPKTSSQRDAICKLMVAMLGVAYDDVAILADATRDLHLPHLWAQNWHGMGTPGHVVCSSLYAYIYMRLDLPHPNVSHERFCEPGDWTRFDWDKGWLA